MGIGVTYAPENADGVTEHEIAARVAVAKALAGLKGFEFGGGSPGGTRAGQRVGRRRFPSGCARSCCRASPLSRARTRAGRRRPCWRRGRCASSTAAAGAAKDRW
jgi:hypothetical protein